MDRLQSIIEKVHEFFNTARESIGRIFGERVELEA